MFWTPGKVYLEEPFEQESELEAAILQVATVLFGADRIYLDAKRKIGAKGRTRNVPDGYLVDLSSNREPKLYVVENEIAKHDPLRHIVVQILEFSLSFESSPQAAKDVVREALRANLEGHSKCHEYAVRHGYDNVDYLLEKLVKSFNALVVIDEIDEDLETVLLSRFKFPVEILTLQRYIGPGDERVFSFDPFLADVTTRPTYPSRTLPSESLDPSEIDTIVVAAHEDGFQEVFLGENRWYKIRIHGSMIPKIKNIAVYRVAPEKAITHIAPVRSIEQWEDTSKYVVNFAEPAREIGPIPLVPNGKEFGVRGPRYTSLERIEKAKNLDDVF